MNLIGLKPMVREASPDDVENIYRLGCKVQLTDDVEKANRDGYLMTYYSAHPEAKDSFRNLIAAGNPFYVYKGNREGLIGFLLGYTEKQWEEERPGLVDSGGEKITWDTRVLEEIGIPDIGKYGLRDFAVLEKIAVDPDCRGRGIAKELQKSFVSPLRRTGVKTIMSEIIEHVYKCEELLNISNSASMAFFTKSGYRKAAESSIYPFDKTFWGSMTRFKDGIYLAQADRINP